MTSSIPTDAITAFGAELAKAGLAPPDSFIVDGAIHRFHVEGDRRGTKNGWYVFYADEVAAGAFGCWKRGISETWCAASETQIDPAEWERIKKCIAAKRMQAEEDRKRIQESVARRAQAFWARAGAANADHPYLVKKGISPHGLRQTGGRLIVPMRNSSGEIRSLQFIGEEGEKRFLRGGQVKGCSFCIGGADGDEGDILVCEGVATGATLHEATGASVICAFNAGNLGSVATAVREQNPARRIVLCADEDAWGKNGLPRPATENTGLLKAKEAAWGVEALVVSPRFENAAPGNSDFNDLAAESSTTEVATQIREGVERQLTLGRARTLSDDDFQRERRTLASDLGVNVSYVDDLRKTPSKDASAATDDDAPQDGSMCDLMVDIGRGANLFHAPDGEPYASISCQGHLETHPLRSSAFGGWMRHQVFLRTGKGVSETTLKCAVETLASIATYEGGSEEVFIRSTRRGDSIYIDLCDTDWTVIEVTARGWGYCESPPVKFTRAPGMHPLPRPKAGGSIDALWPLLNVSRAERPLIAGFLTSSLRGEGPFFILNLFGTEGAAKSTATSFVRGLLDPNEAELATMPKDQRDLAISASGQLVVTFENISYLRGHQSDWMCRLATGSAFKTRSLYTNDEETIFKFCRPGIVNGIPNVVSRGDLASRAISVELQKIDAEQRKEEAVIKGDFETALPELFGALLNALACGLRYEEEVREEFKGKLPRNADAAVFATAAEEAFGFKRGAFLDALELAQLSDLHEIVENDPVGQGVIALVGDHDGNWEGTATELLETLREVIPAATQRDPSFPKNAKTTSERLNRLEKPLMVRGIRFERKKSGSNKTISIFREERPDGASHCVPAPASQCRVRPDGTHRDAHNHQPTNEPLDQVLL